MRSLWLWECARRQHKKNRNKSMNVFVELYMWDEKAHSKREWYDVEVPKTHLRLYDEFSFIVFFLFYYTILYFSLFYFSICPLCCVSLSHQGKMSGMMRCMEWCYNLEYDGLSKWFIDKVTFVSGIQEDTRIEHNAVF